MVKPIFISQTSLSFPNLLKEIPSCPLTINYLGDLELLNNQKLKLAIVGTRRASSIGLNFARQLARELSQSGITIISGLALGIDQAAHRGCLDGAGLTIAVLANGLNNIYPRQHQSLAESIIKTGGALVSEYDPDAPALPHQFLERNRIVSGLCQGVIVVEAPARSGALNTAAHALEQNREVFVAPGAVNHSNYQGSNELIKQGANLITSANDILDYFHIDHSIAPSLPALNLTSDQQLIINSLKLSDGGLVIDKICELTKLEHRIVNREIANLVINEIIKDTNGRYFI